MVARRSRYCEASVAKHFMWSEKSVVVFRPLSSWSPAPESVSACTACPACRTRLTISCQRSEPHRIQLRSGEGTSSRALSVCKGNRLRSEREGARSAIVKEHSKIIGPQRGGSSRTVSSPSSCCHGLWVRDLHWIGQCQVSSIVS